MDRFLTLALRVLIGNLPSNSKNSFESISVQSTNIARKAAINIFLLSFAIVLLVFCLVKSFIFIESILSENLINGYEIVNSFYILISCAAFVVAVSLYFFQAKRNAKAKAERRVPIHDISLNNLALEFVYGFIDGFTSNKPLQQHRELARRNGSELIN